MGALAERQAGSVVAGRYRLMRVLGRGGMGVVFEAEHAMTRRRVAVKILHPQQRESTEAARRFINEAQAAGALSHPNVVEVLDAGEDSDGSLFLVLELLSGQDLATRILKKRRLEVAEVVTVGAQVAQALSTAHAKGIIHRDIKPENIFLTRSVTGEVLVKILDFGISKAMNPDPAHGNLSVTQTNTTVGTPHYMSPEQARGERNIDPRADLWALGVVMYECLAGRVPFDGDTYNDQIVKVITEPHVSLAQYDVPSDFARVVDRLLEKDRNRRYPDAARLLRDLRTFIERHPEYPVPQHILRDPVLPGAATPSAGSTTPTLETSLDPARSAQNTFSVPSSVAPSADKTIPNSPAAGGSLFDTGANDESPTRIHSSNEQSPSNLRKLAIGAAVVILAVVIGVVIALSMHRKPQEPSPVAMISLRVQKLPPGAQLVVSGVPIYNSNTAVVPRGSKEVAIEVRLNGFVPVHIDVMPDRDQDVVLPTFVPITPTVTVLDAGAVVTQPPSVADAAVIPTVPATVDAATQPVIVDASTAPALTTSDAGTPSTVAPNTNPVTPTPHVTTVNPPPVRTTTTTSSPSTTPPQHPVVVAGPPGSITVRATPECTVLIDSSLRGQSPVIRSSASPGTHRVFCRLDTGALRSRMVTVKSGIESVVEFLP